MTKLLRKDYWSSRIREGAEGVEVGEEEDRYGNQRTTQEIVIEMGLFLILTMVLVIWIYK